MYKIVGVNHYLLKEDIEVTDQVAVGKLQRWLQQTHLRRNQVQNLTVECISIVLFVLFLHYFFVLIFLHGCCCTAEDVTLSEDIQEPRSSGGLQGSTKSCYFLERGLKLTRIQKARVNALVKESRTVIPFYVPAMKKESLSDGFLVRLQYPLESMAELAFVTLCSEILMKLRLSW